MSTRGICGLRVNGQDKLTYNHCDSYPDWLGEEMLKFAKECKGNFDYWKEKAIALKIVENEAKPADEELAELSRRYTVEGRVWYDILRNRQGDLKRMLEGGYACESPTFIYDSLFCEWAYIINFDTKTLEVYQGYQKQPHDKGRYAHNLDESSSYRTTIFYPCALVAELSFDNLPENMSFLIGEDE